MIGPSTSPPGQQLKPQPHMTKTRWGTGSLEPSRMILPSMTLELLELSSSPSGSAIVSRSAPLGQASSASTFGNTSIPRTLSSAKTSSVTRTAGSAPLAPRAPRTADTITADAASSTQEKPTPAPKVATQAPLKGSSLRTQSSTPVGKTRLASSSGEGPNRYPPRPWEEPKLPVPSLAPIVLRRQDGCESLYPEDPRALDRVVQSMSPWIVGFLPQIPWKMDSDEGEEKGVRYG
ncbi:hypothetical protein GGS26DRAFT_575830 [Hypomontagnella submonticulosa]|nr:hypothetical protein GGS26DRAFT_575830 [Hypomontagnella submonticulosa]